MSRRAYDAAVAVEEACETVVALLRDGPGALRCIDGIVQREHPLPDDVWRLLEALHALRLRVADMDREFEFDGVPDPLTPEPAAALTELRARVRHALHAIETDPAMEERETDQALQRAANHVRAALGEQHDDAATPGLTRAELELVGTACVLDVRTYKCDIYRKRAEQMRADMEEWRAEVAAYPHYHTCEFAEVVWRLDWILNGGGR